MLRNEPVERHLLTVNELADLAKEACFSSSHLEAWRRYGYEPDDAVQEILIWYQDHPQQVSFLSGVPTRSQQLSTINRDAHRRILDIRPRNVVDNLIDRLHALARNGLIARDIFLSKYAFASKMPVPSPRSLADARIRDIANACHPVPQLPENLASSRSSMVYTSESLKHLVKLAFEIEQSIWIDDFRKIFDNLLTSRLVSTASINEEALQRESESPIMNLLVERVATSLTTQISGEMQAALFAVTQDVGQVEVASILGISRPTLTKRLAQALDQLKRSLDGLDERELIAVTQAAYESFARSWEALTSDEGDVDA
jgi:hypothetical protein